MKWTWTTGTCWVRATSSSRSGGLFWEMKGGSIRSLGSHKRPRLSLSLFPAVFEHDLKGYADTQQCWLFLRHTGGNICTGAFLMLAEPNSDSTTWCCWPTDALMMNHFLNHLIPGWGWRHKRNAFKIYMPRWDVTCSISSLASSVWTETSKSKSGHTKELNWKMAAHFLTRLTPLKAESDIKPFFSFFLQKCYQ